MVHLIIVAACLGSTVQAVSEPELVAISHVIALGSVIDTQVVVQGAQVRTQHRLQVHQGIRGSREGEVLVLEVPGGTHAGVVHEVTGAPKLTPGQMVLAFLEQHGGVFRPLGLSLGVYFVGGHESQLYQAQPAPHQMFLVRSGGHSLADYRRPESLLTLLSRLTALTEALP